MSKSGWAYNFNEEPPYQAPRARVSVEEAAEPLLRGARAARADGVTRVPFIELSERCLAVLRERPRLVASEVAAATDRKESTIKKVLTQLYNEGHIERDRHSTKSHYVYWVPK